MDEISRNKVYRLKKQLHSSEFALETVKARKVNANHFIVLYDPLPQDEGGCKICT